jgi:two-component system LytT family sensor kinase
MAAVLVALVAAAALRSRNALGTAADSATLRALHTASLAAPPLRGGLTAQSAGKAVKHLRTLLGADAVVVTDTHTSLAWDRLGDVSAAAAPHHARDALAQGRTSVVATGPTPVGRVPRFAAAAPLTTDDAVVGALVAYTWSRPSATMVRALEEVARFVSGQLDLAELDRSRSRAAEAEVRALRAQISPHFVYNSLTAIASFVRTDPDRARELLLEFADFTRYSFRRHGDFTTLADELRSIEQYLMLERARFGDRLQVTLRVAPEVLPVALPFLCLQPLVENAVRHGLEGRPGTGHVTVLAEDRGAECRISVEDDGVGIDPEDVRRVLDGQAAGDHVGLGNVDERLRKAFGDDYGVTVETAPGAGTKVSLRIPKYAAGVRAS